MTLCGSSSVVRDIPRQTDVVTVQTTVTGSIDLVAGVEIPISTYGRICSLLSFLMVSVAFLVVHRAFGLSSLDLFPRVAPTVTIRFESTRLDPEIRAPELERQALYLRRCLRNRGTVLESARFAVTVLPSRSVMNELRVERDEGGWEDSIGVLLRLTGTCPDRDSLDLYVKNLRVTIPRVAVEHAEAVDVAPDQSRSGASEAESVAAREEAVGLSFSLASDIEKPSADFVSRSDSPDDVEESRPVPLARVRIPSVELSSAGRPDARQEVGKL